MRLPPELDRQLLRDLEQIEEVRRMPYVTSAERIGIEKGLREGLLIGIEQVLKLKFGAAGEELLPEIRQIGDLGLIREISGRLPTAATTDEVRQIYR